MYFYTVAVAAVVHRQNAIFTYRSPTPLRKGTLVRVPLGKVEANGVILARSKKPEFTTREIISILHPEYTLPAPLFDLAMWMSAYYATHLGMVLQSMLPPGLHKQRRAQEHSPITPTRIKKNITLTSAQQIALDQIITAQNQHAFLLHGVPGSGKTQIYIEASKTMIENGKSVIVLVPEIGLTTQLIAEFANHFAHVYVIHSAMTEAERHLVWQKMLQHTAPCVVIGPRSALFSPLKDVGLIVIDECHEQSFKQDRAPRYNALYAARQLAQLHRAKIVYGSATPNVTEMYLAQQKKLQLLELPVAIQTTDNTIQVITHSQRDKFTKHRFISSPLIAAIEASLSHNEQALVFHNRRGTTPSVICESCGWQAMCRKCQLPLTFHGDNLELRCHTCNLIEFLVHTCPECSQPTIVFKGIGTKLVASELAKLFPSARIARFDADNAKHEQLQQRYQELYDGAIDILVGTQIIAKGLDLPRISTVGILQADAGLRLPDFSAAERTFQLLYQVGGRAGRSSKAGTVIMQTYSPEARSIVAAAAHDFDSFAATELLERSRNHYPPFYFLLKLSYSAKTEKAVIRSAKKLAQELTLAYPDIEIAGPAPAFHEQQNNIFHWQILLKSKKRAPLLVIAASLPSNWQFDLDPISLL